MPNWLSDEASKAEEIRRRWGDENPSSLYFTTPNLEGELARFLQSKQLDRQFGGNAELLSRSRILPWEPLVIKISSPSVNPLPLFISVCGVGSSVAQVGDESDGDKMINFYRLWGNPQAVEA